MGLDMYLYKETYVQQWPHQLEEDAFKITITKGVNLLYKSNLNVLLQLKKRWVTGEKLMLFIIGL